MTQFAPERTQIGFLNHNQGEFSPANRPAHPLQVCNAKSGHSPALDVKREGKIVGLCRERDLCRNRDAKRNLKDAGKNTDYGKNKIGSKNASTRRHYDIGQTH